MNRSSFIYMFVCILTFFGFRYVQDIVFKIPKSWPKPMYDFDKNPLSEEKIELGRVLFYDPILSRDLTISCATCHSQYNAFTHVDHALSHGIEDRIGIRNSPTLMNLAWQENFMWDGAINHLDMQALAPISHPDEMDEEIGRVLQKLQNNGLYPSLFEKAYGDNAINTERLLKSISQFMLTLVSHQSKYDSVKNNEAAFTTQEGNGYQLFKNNCASCHAEPLFTNHSFQNNGLPIDETLSDFGRIMVTQIPSDSLKFKVPTLRNIEFSYPYMHDGRFKRLSEVLNHYTNASTQKIFRDQGLNEIKLSANEKVDIVAFLLTLTDKSFLFNPKFSYPKNILLSTAKD